MTGTKFKGETFFDGANIQPPDPSKSKANFQQVHFAKRTHFQGMKLQIPADFTHGIFSGSANFQETQFSQEVTFAWAEFRKKANFSHLSFPHPISFRKTKFNGSVNFSQTKFIKECTFREAEFSSSSMFFKTEFQEQVEFWKAILRGLANFNQTEFKANAIFLELLVPGILRFENIQIQHPLSIAKCDIFQLVYKTHSSEPLILFNQLNLNVAEHFENIGHLSFEDQDCSKLAFVNSNLEWADFLGGDIRETRFDTCTWSHKMGDLPYSQLYGHSNIVDAFTGLTQTIIHPNPDAQIQILTQFVSQLELLNEQNPGKWDIDLQVHQKMLSERVKDKELLYTIDRIIPRVELLQSLYLQFKKRYDDSHDYRRSGEFHYWEMMLRLLLQEHKMPAFSISPKSFLSQKIENLLMRVYRWIGDFGENYIRLLLFVFAWIALVAAMISLGQSDLGKDTSAQFTQFYHWLPEFIQRFLSGIKQAISILLPGSFLKNKIIEDLNGISKFVIAGGGLGAFTLLALFVMSIRRRFRR